MIKKLIIFLICLPLVYAGFAGEIIESQGGATIKRNSLKLPASQGVKLLCGDVVIGSTESSYVRFSVNKKAVEINGKEDWHISCGSGASITLLSGKAYVTRGLKQIKARENMNLMVGDTISSEPGSKLKIKLSNGEIVSLQGKSYYVISEFDKPEIMDKVKVFFSKVKNYLMGFLKGESFEIKVPADGIGSRG